MLGSFPHEQTASRYNSVSAKDHGYACRLRGRVYRYACGGGLVDREVCDTRSSMVGCIARERQRHPDFVCTRGPGFCSFGKLAGKSLPLFARILQVRVLPPAIAEAPQVVQLRRGTGRGDYFICR